MPGNPSTTDGDAFLDSSIDDKWLALYLDAAFTEEATGTNGLKRIYTGKDGTAVFGPAANGTKANIKDIVTDTATGDVGTIKYFKLMHTEKGNEHSWSGELDIAKHIEANDEWAAHAGELVFSVNVA